MLNMVNIEATNLSDAWFQCIRNCFEKGYTYTIDKGSFEGTKRLGMDFVTVQIKNPSEKPLTPFTPLGIESPTSEEYIDEYMTYLMTDVKQKNEQYTYGERIAPQIPEIIRRYKEEGEGCNQLCMEIGSPSDLMLPDPPCLRLIDTRIRYGKLHFIVYFRSWDLWCISDDSEILCESGWKNIDTISVIDKVATYDTNSENIIFRDIKGINKQLYQGKMLHINTKRIDQLVTPNHKILHKYVTHAGSKRIIKDFRYTEAKDIECKDGSFMPLNGNPYSGSMSIGKEKASLLGWIISEGHFRNGCDTIDIYQSSRNEKYVDEIRNILDVVCNNTYKEYVQSKTYKDYDYKLHRFHIPAAVVRELQIKTFIPNKIPAFELINLQLDERYELFMSLIKGDGSIKTSKKGSISFVFDQNNKYLLEWFQLLSFSLGYNALINIDRMRVNVSSKKESMIQRTHFVGGKLPEVDYEGKVWCVSTDANNFVMRRDNKISITGNSGFPTNLGGLQLLKEYMADEIGVEDGEIVAISKGLHLYDYVWEQAKIVSGLGES